MNFMLARVSRSWMIASAVAAVLGSPISAAADELATQRAEQDKKFAAALDRLASLCDKYGLGQQAKFTRGWHVKRDPAQLYVFEHTDSFVPEDLAQTTTEQERVWLTEFAKYRKAQARWLYEHAKAAAGAGQVGLSLELIYEALREDPDHGEARRILGYEKSDEQWLTAFEAQQKRRSLVWHDEFGWIARADVARYEKGERREGVRWMSAEEDAARHAAIERGWTVDTGHFRITTNHSLAAGAQLGHKLEQLYHVWRQLFAGYLHSPAQAESWFRSGEVKEPRRRFEVVYFRTREDYNAYLKRWEPNIAISLGYYSDRQRKSYFFAGEDQDPATVLHEATHQLFSESRATRKDCGENSHFWIIEGIACYMESLARGDGYWATGGAEAGRTPAARVRLLRDSFYIPFDKLTAMGRADLQTNADIRKIYSQISGQSAFLMHASGGRYRDALVDYLLDIYTTARLPANLLEKHIGRKHAQLDAEYRAFMERQTPRSSDAD